MDAKLEPILLYGGLALVAYLLLKKAKDQLSEGGGLVGSVGDVLVGAPAPTTTTTIAPVPAQQTARGLFVRWISPAPNGRANRPLFRRDYSATIELENATGGPITGLLEVQVSEDGLVGSPTTITTTAGPYTFANGERRQITLALKTDTLVATLATATVRLAGRLALPDQAQQYVIA